MGLDFIMDENIYTGNGGTVTVVTGFQPVFVFILSENTGGSGASRAASFKTSDMPGDDFVECNTAANITTTNGITINSDGFTVGSDNSINGNGNTYAWMALGSHPTVEVGTYVGDGGALSQQTIVTNRMPAAMLVFRYNGSPTTVYFKIDSMVSSGAAFATAYLVDATNAIEFVNNGFIVKNTASETFNQSGETYLYLALYNKPGTRNFITDSFVTPITNSAVPYPMGRAPRAIWAFGDVQGSFNFYGRIATGTLTTAFNSGASIQCIGETFLGPPEGWRFTPNSTFTDIVQTVYWLTFMY